MKTKKLKLLICSLFLMSVPILSLSARDGGYHGNSDGNHPNYGSNQRNDSFGNDEFRHNYNDGYGGGFYGGGYGGGFYDGYVNPYPPPGSQPGMGDDSNALYDSYLQKNGQGY